MVGMFHTSRQVAQFSSQNIHGIGDDDATASFRFSKLTFVTSLENRSKLHSPLAVPKVHFWFHGIRWDQGTVQ